MQTAKLNQIMTDMVMKQVVEDKLACATTTQAGGCLGYGEGKNSLLEGNEDQHNAAQDIAEDKGEDMSSWRERRMQQLKDRRRKEEQLRAEGNGVYSEITEEQFLSTVTKANLAVCHFYQDDFETCKILDMHLQRLAGLHVETRFVKISAPRSPFFVTKLKVRTLPSTVLFVDGKAIHTLVGFAELGGSNTFTTRRLEVVLKKYRLVDDVRYTKETQDDVSSEED
eukprot:GHVQ01041783.1.p1 GENE.GHVQ01041783.1~~GHVQ01041783.1.p1  ORF type:complete len:225 (-),score=43.95 GHVQ01041783.1:715-1389(-)